MQGRERVMLRVAGKTVVGGGKGSKKGATAAAPSPARSGRGNGGGDGRPGAMQPWQQQQAQQPCGGQQQQRYGPYQHQHQQANVEDPIDLCDEEEEGGEVLLRRQLLQVRTGLHMAWCCSSGVAHWRCHLHAACAVLLSPRAKPLVLPAVRWVIALSRNLCLCRPPSASSAWPFGPVCQCYSHMVLSPSAFLRPNQCSFSPSIAIQAALGELSKAIRTTTNLSRVPLNTAMQAAVSTHGGSLQASVSRKR